jgi:hypothetical protein
LTDRATPKTAVILGFVWSLAAVWSVCRGRWLIAELLGGLSITLILIGLLSPTGARAVHREWMRLSAALGSVNSRILLSIVYLAIVAPYGYVLRLMGRDPLNRRGPAKPTYWMPRSATRQRKEQFERLF